MATNNVLGIIFANAYDSTIPEITALRAMGSVPFAGRYRLIDLPLSSMVNAGITNVGVITKSNYRSLMDHLGSGKAWDLSRKNEGLKILPPFSIPDSGDVISKISALYGSISFISESGKDYVLFADCNSVSGIDFADVIEFNAKKNADITMVCAKGMPANIARATEVVTDADGKVTELKKMDDFSKEVNYSAKCCIIKRVLLERLLHEANAKRITSFEELFAANVENLNAYAYQYEGYIKVIDSIEAYYDASMDLLDPEVRKAVFNAENPVYTKAGDRTPAMYGKDADVKNSLISDGCKIEGTIENCLLSRGVKIGKNSKITNSIIMQDTIIGDNVELDCVIIDKDATIKNNKKLCGASNYPVFVGKGIVI